MLRGALVEKAVDRMRVVLIAMNHVGFLMSR